MPNEKLAVIIPTKERPDELRRILECISAQSLRPEQVIVVDGGTLSVKDLVAGFDDPKIDYVRVVPASLTAQRNAGIKAVREDMTLVAFFDDDVVLEEGAMKAMMEFWRDAPVDTGGAAFNITNEIYRCPGFFERFFLVNDPRPGRILRSGFQSRVARVDSTMQVDWLAGCSMVWRRRVFDDCMFDEHFSGYARYEEVDFSYRVGKKYKLYIVAPARIAHLSRSEEVSSSAALARMEVVNRFYFVKKSGSLSKGLCLWALFGITLNNIVRGIFAMNRRCLYRAWGDLKGLCDIIMGR